MGLAEPSRAVLMSVVKEKSIRHKLCRLVRRSVGKLTLNVARYVSEAGGTIGITRVTYNRRGRWSFKINEQRSHVHRRRKR